MAEYLVHKAVDLAKVLKVRRAILSQPGYLDQNYLAQAKYDGCNVIFVLTVAGENDQVLSRTGEKVPSMYHLLKDMHTLFADQVMEHGGVTVLGEAWIPDQEFSYISGKFRQHKPALDMEVRVFDVLTASEWEAGHSTETYMKRLTRVLRPIYSLYTTGHIQSATTHFVPGTTGHSTWQDWCNHMVDLGGYDGLILRDPEGTWHRGPGTTGEIIKLKRRLSFDLRVIGLEEGKGKHAGRLGAIVVDFQGEELRVGTGFTDAERIGYWADECLILGAIVEVEAMDYSSDGLLREPRFKGVRFDKLETD